MIERNLKVYLRDRGAVLSALVAVFVVIALYVFFLGNYLESTIVAKIGEKEGIFLFINSWVLSGVLIICPISISLGLFGVKVQDEQNDAYKSFLVTPLKKRHIVTSYIVSAWLVSFIVTVIVFLLWILVMFVLGYKLVTIGLFIKILFYVALNVFAATSMTYFLTCFIKSSNAFSSISTVVGTLTGFLSGIYLPIGSLPNFVQSVMKSFPPTYGVAQMRDSLTELPLEAITKGDSLDYVLDLKNNLGISIQVFGFTLSTQMLIIILIATGLLFWFASIMPVRMRLA